MVNVDLSCATITGSCPLSSYNLSWSAFDASQSELNLDCNDQTTGILSSYTVYLYCNGQVVDACSNVLQVLDPFSICTNPLVGDDTGGRRLNGTGPDFENKEKSSFNPFSRSANGGLTSSDNCGIDSIMVNPSTFDCSDIGTNTVTITVTDESGNTGICQSTVTVADTTAPTCSVQDVTVNLDDSGAACLDYAASLDDCKKIIVGLGTIGSTMVNVDQSCAVISGGCPLSSFSLSWSAVNSSQTDLNLDCSDQTIGITTMSVSYTHLTLPTTPYV